ncbi:MAG: hypothetical protein AAFZ15_02815 [Bacteroidota bacterium]
MKNIFKVQSAESRMSSNFFFSLNAALFFLLLFFAQTIFAQVEDSKTVKKDFAPQDIVRLQHAHGPMVVKNSTNGKVHIEAVFSAKAKDQKNLDIFLDHFDVKSATRGKLLEISTTSDIESWNSNNKVTTIKFSDGQRAKGIQDIVMSATLYVPNLEELQLKNKYGDIDLDAKAPDNLTVELFSGKLETTNSINEFDLTIKYGKCYIADAKNAKLNLFDSDLRTGNLGTTEVLSKYSECEVMDVNGDFTMQTFDDKWEIQNISGQFKFNDKYSEYKVETFGEADGTVFDGELIATTGKKLTLRDSKYSKYKISSLDELTGHVIFDDDFEIGNIESINVENSKYTSYRIDGLEDAFSSNQAFDDEIKIGKIAADFDNVFLEGKYTKMDFFIEKDAQFAVDVAMQYGKFDHPDFDVRIHKELNSKIELKGFVGKEQTNNTKKLTIKGFDNQVYWK